MKGNVEELMDSKLRTALEISRNHRGGEEVWEFHSNKSGPENKAIQEDKNVSDAKDYRQWNRNLRTHSKELGRRQGSW